MPAMPQAATDNGYGCNHAESFNGLVPVGLTKREMFAMHQDVNSVFENYFDCYKSMASFIGEEWRSGFNDFQNINLEMKVKAKLRVMAADALLEELSK